MLSGDEDCVHVEFVLQLLTMLGDSGIFSLQLAYLSSSVLPIRTPRTTWAGLSHLVAMAIRCDLCDDDVDLSCNLLR